MATQSDSASRSFTIRRHHLEDTVVLSLTGALDHAAPLAAGAGVEATMVEVELALRRRPRVLVADLSRVEVSRLLVGLLGLVRRRAVRVGVPVVLAAVSPAGLTELALARVAPLYPTYPDVGSALGDRACALASG
ncbi:hypothetical protein [Phycicoccus sp.]|uniref:hypothetical protein n=1 Tax=Phycicoccus sp. TaxID=1902410 RepID=UPI002CE40447|nr:hypothetical protein [Phycicoccus sp.]HMM94060.1 hypothetical protein [Phycicoccus sp.]